jgi:predicted nucleic acid-binding protein
MRVYLDNCCFNRPFDDQRQLRIRLETEAKLGIQAMIQSGEIELAWSYLLDYENELNPFEQRKVLIRPWRRRALVDTGATPEILAKARTFTQKGLKSKDALHLACALELHCDCFITTDDELIKKSSDVEGIMVIDPTTFIREGLA